jgi:hypothetical protein
MSDTDLLLAAINGEPTTEPVIIPVLQPITVQVAKLTAPEFVDGVEDWDWIEQKWMDERKYEEAK